MHSVWACIVQELLQYTMHQRLDEVEPMQAEHNNEFDDWAALESALPDGQSIPSSENGSPFKAPMNTKTDSPTQVLMLPALG